MRAVLGGVIAAAALAPAAHAGEWSANIAITSDYTFRGYTQSMGEPAVQGGFDKMRVIVALPLDKMNDAIRHLVLALSITAALVLLAIALTI